MVFEDGTLANLAQHLSAEALATTVMFTDRLSNRVLAVHLTLRDGSSLIAVNARFKIDPELMAHTLVEEYVHAQQILNGVDFASQRQQFPDYEARPYERDAKALASDLLGYTPAGFQTVLIRDEPALVLYDRHAE